MDLDSHIFVSIKSKLELKVILLLIAAFASSKEGAKVIELATGSSM